MPPPIIQRQMDKQRVRDIWDARPADKRRQKDKDRFVEELRHDEGSLVARLGSDPYQTIYALLLGRESD